MEEVNRRIEEVIKTGATILDLSYLELTSLPENLFVSLSNLEELYLSNNKLNDFTRKYIYIST